MICAAALVVDVDAVCIHAVISKQPLDNISLWADVILLCNTLCIERHRVLVVSESNIMLSLLLSVHGGNVFFRWRNLLVSFFYTILI
jgi:hypothetical protein